MLAAAAPVDDDLDRNHDVWDMAVDVTSVM